MQDYWHKLILPHSKARHAVFTYMYIDNHPYKLLAETKKCQNGFHVKAYTFYIEINIKTLHFGHSVRSISTFHWPISAYYQTLSMQPR